MPRKRLPKIIPPFRLFDLPRELRNAIYDAILDNLEVHTPRVKIRNWSKRLLIAKDVIESVLCSSAAAPAAGSSQSVARPPLHSLPFPCQVRQRVRPVGLQDLLVAHATLAREICEQLARRGQYVTLDVDVRSAPESLGKQPVVHWKPRRFLHPNLMHSIRHARVREVFLGPSWPPERGLRRVVNAIMRSFFATAVRELYEQLPRLQAVDIECLRLWCHDALLLLEDDPRARDLFVRERVVVQPLRSTPVRCRVERESAQEWDARLAASPPQ